MIRNRTKMTLAMTLGGTLAFGAVAGSSGKRVAASMGTLTVGVVGPFSGPYAELGLNLNQGAALAIADINKHGGVLGHQLRLASQDDALDAVDAVPATNTLINIDHVVAIVGNSSHTATAVLPIASKANIPDFVTGGGAEFDKITNPHFFRMAPSDTETAQGIVEYAHMRGWNRIGLSLDNSGPSQALLAPIQKTAKKLRMRIVASVTPVAGLTSYLSTISQLYANHPQAILGQMDNATSGTMFGEIQQQGLESTPWIGTDAWGDPSFFDSVGAQTATGLIYPTAAASGASLGGLQLQRLWQKQYHTALPPEGAAATWDATMLFALGAEEAGTWKYPGLEKGILAIASPPGTKVGSYAEGYRLLQEHKKINYEGAITNDNFNQYHNVYGPVSVLRYNADKTLRVVSTLTADQIAKALK